MALKLKLVQQTENSLCQKILLDQGGITAALTAAKEEDDVDLKAFFSQWAKIWRMKASTEFQTNAFINGCPCSC
ncbi:Neutral endopeptidase [Lactococcus lactis]|nr:Neutral endopeptidase [Lactococcus lactis]